MRVTISSTKFTTYTNTLHYMRPQINREFGDSKETSLRDIRIKTHTYEKNEAKKKKSIYEVAREF